MKRYKSIQNTDVMDSHDAAAFLGAHVETIRRLARGGRIPSFKVGKDWRFRRDSIERWAERWSQSRTQGSDLPYVLIIDDEASVRQVVSGAVERLGYRTAQAGDANSALLTVARNRPGLILLDLIMPGMSGVEFLKEVRTIHPELPVAIITGYPDSDLIAEALAYGPLMIIQKPTHESQLKVVLEMALGEHIPAS